MGLVSNQAVFDYPAPDIENILKELKVVTGLTVVTVNQDQSETEDDFACDDLHDFIHHIDFKDFPHFSIEIYAYLPNAVRDSIEKDKQETDVDDLWLHACEGSDEKEGEQTIYINTYLGRELTLFNATMHALESLGGRRVKHPFTGEKNEVFPLTIEILRKRHKKARRQIIYGWIASLLMLPVILPVLLIKALIYIVKLPFDIRKNLNALKQQYPDKFKNES